MLGPLHFESSRIGFVTRVTHQCLHEPHPLDTESLDGLEHIHHLLSLHPLQHSVQGAECTTAPKTVTRGRERIVKRVTQYTLSLLYWYTCAMQYPTYM